MARILKEGLWNFVMSRIPQSEAALSAQGPIEAYTTILKAMIGIQESGGNNRGKLVSLLQMTDDGKASGESWCMLAQQFAFGMAERLTGVKANPIVSAHCMTTFRAAKKSGHALALDRIERGDLIIWNHAGTDNGHVGGVLQTIGKAGFPDSYWTTVEGNTSEGPGVERDGDGMFLRMRRTTKIGDMIPVGGIRVFGVV